MRDNRDILDKLRWLSNDMEYMEVPGEWLLPVTEAHSIIVRQREEVERLRAEGDKARARGDKLRMALEDIAYPNPLHNEDNLMGIARAVLEEK